MSSIDLTREKFRMYVNVTDTTDGIEKFFVIGEKSSSGTIAFNTSTETINDITQKTGTSIAKAGAWSMPVSMAQINLDDDVKKALLTATINLDFNREFDILVVWEFITKRDTDGTVMPDMYLAHSFKSILPLADIGGDGQSPLVANYTVNSTTDVKRGFIDISEASGKYNALTDTYTADAFTLDEDSKLSIEYVATVASKSTSNTEI